MKLQDQVCTLEQAKKLKELGVRQQSAFKYNQNLYETDKAGELEEGVWTIWYNDFPCLENQYSAFTVAELGVMLPSETLTIRRGSEDSKFPNWEWENEGEEKGWGCFDTEASARADHLIMLLQKDIIKVEEVNQRLAA